MKHVANMEQKKILELALVNGLWHKARTLPLQGVTIRSLCHQFPTLFVGTNKGYKLAEHCTLGEIRWSINSLRSRARAINERADRLEDFSFQDEFDF